MMIEQYKKGYDGQVRKRKALKCDRCLNREWDYWLDTDTCNVDHRPLHNVYYPEIYGVRASDWICPADKEDIRITENTEDGNQPSKCGSCFFMGINQCRNIKRAEVKEDRVTLKYTIVDDDACELYREKR